MKVLCFVTSRPSYSRIKTVLQGFENIGLEYGVVCLASATEALYGDIADLIVADGFKVVRRLHTQLATNNGLTSTKTTALGLLSAAEIIDAERPNAVISIADRYETIATAIAASYQNITCIHIQGGETTGNIDDKVRDAVSALSDVHFPASVSAAERLRGFVKHPYRVFNHGCPGIDLFVAAPHLTSAETISAALKKSVGQNYEYDMPYTVVMMHPDTNNIAGSEQFTKSLLEQSLLPGNQFFWFWPNADPGSDVVSKTIRIHREKYPHSNLHLVKNLKTDLFVNLLRHSKGLVGNSSVGVRETGILGLPTVDVGSRQSNREKHDNVVSVSYDAPGERVIAELNMKRRVPSYTYGKGDAGQRIAESISEILEEERCR